MKRIPARGMLMGVCLWAIAGTIRSAQAVPTPWPIPNTTAQSQRGGLDCSEVQDSCPVAGGVKWKCKQRFMLGVNYAWAHFAGDFGGIRPWGHKGVSENPEIERDLMDMKAHGASVVRWWIFPDLRGDGMVLDAESKPQGLGGSFVADLHHALALAAKHDIYLMLTLFSFDGFRPTGEHGGINVTSLRDIVLDDMKTRALLDQVVAPLAQMVAASPNADRLLAWDIMNEPEWAVSGPSLYGGDQDFDPLPGLITISHSEMERFLVQVAATLRANSQALITIGAASMKWRHAWLHVDQDFYQFHIYDWMNQWWPYDRSPQHYGLGDKPVVMGEFPARGLVGVGAESVLETWFSIGYGGGLPWSVTDHNFDWHGNKYRLRDFAQRYACEARY